MTVARARNLCDLAAAMLSEGARKHFLFSGYGQLLPGSPNRVFGDIYFSARDHGRDVMYPLVPEPESSLKRTA